MPFVVRNRTKIMKSSRSMKTSSDMLVISISPTKKMFWVSVEMQGLMRLNWHRFDSRIWTLDQRMAKFQVSNPYFKLIPTLVGNRPWPKFWIVSGPYGTDPIWPFSIPWPFTKMKKSESPNGLIKKRLFTYFGHSLALTDRRNNLISKLNRRAPFLENVHYLRLLKFSLNEVF